MTRNDLHQPNNLRNHVNHLARHIGERHMWRNNSLSRSAEYIEHHFAAHGYSPVRQNYQAYGKTVANIIAEKRIPASQTIVIGAHYDTVPGSPGADDNASSVAGLLELARIMNHRPCPCSLIFAAFVNEESPSYGSEYMGSMQYARQLKRRKRNILYMVSLETIGYFKKDMKQNYPIGLMRSFYPKTADFIAVIGDLNSMRHVRGMARSIRRFGGIKASTLIAPRHFAGIDRSDHMAFWHYGFKALMITDTANYRNPNYHRETDTVDTLDFEMMSKVISGIRGALIQ